MLHLGVIVEHGFSNLGGYHYVNQEVMYLPPLLYTLYNQYVT